MLGMESWFEVTVFASGLDDDGDVLGGLDLRGVDLPSVMTPVSPLCRLFYCVV